MEYTFHALFVPKSRLIDQKQRLADQHGVEILDRQFFNQLRNLWQVRRHGLEDIHNIDVWNSLFQTVSMLGLSGCIEQIGIVFSPARRIVSGGALLGGYNSARYETGQHSYWYQIESDTLSVPGDSVGVFLTEQKNSLTFMGPITGEQWASFGAVIYKFDQLFRATRKLDQLRGQKDNRKAFERLCTEVVEIMQTMI